MLGKGQLSARHCKVCRAKPQQRDVSDTLRISLQILAPLKTPGRWWQRQYVFLKTVATSMFEIGNALAKALNSRFATVFLFPALNSTIVPVSIPQQRKDSKGSIIAVPTRFRTCTIATLRTPM